MTASRAPKHPGGRRPGDSGTRDALLGAAARLFAERGYDGASMRLIAGEAGVDPALIRHFFGDKQGLYAATLADDSNINQALAAVLTGDPAEVGRRASAAYLGLWEDEPTATTLRALFRSAVASDKAVNAFTQVMAPHILAAGPPRLSAPLALRHVALAGAQLLGIAVGRYVLALEPLATMTRDEVVDAVAPAIQRHLEQALRPD
jgi:AcrR family transcriptional regulator